MIYELNYAGCTAKIESLGAELVSFQGSDGFEALWQGDTQYWGGHAPVLFPIVGALRDNKVKIGGEWFEMGRHGFARKMEFTVSEQSVERISLCLASSFETKKFYPFEFRLTVSYSLGERGLTTSFGVENLGSGVMPFVVGGHPGFNIPVGEQAAFEDYTIVFEKSETQKCPRIDLQTCLIDPSDVHFELKGEREIPLRHQLFYGDALVFENLNSNLVQVLHKESGKGIEMDFSGFPMLGIWSALNDGPYVALEPWTGCATRTDEGDELEKKKGMAFLPAGGRADYAFTVRIL